MKLIRQGSNARSGIQNMTLYEIHDDAYHITGNQVMNFLVEDIFEPFSYMISISSELVYFDVTRKNEIIGKYGD